MSCVLHIAPSLALRFLLFSSHEAITLTGENETILSYLSLSLLLLLPLLPISNPIRDISILSFHFSPFSFLDFHCRCFACVHLQKKKRRKKEVFNAAVDDNNNDSRSRLVVVIFFIPELLLAKSC